MRGDALGGGGDGVFGAGWVLVVQVSAGRTVRMKFLFRRGSEGEV